MPQVFISERACLSIERLTEFLLARDPAAAAETLELIESSLRILVQHPLVGRPVEHGLRELVISRGSTGYLALYRFHEVRDVVHVLAIRHQREAGCD